MNNYEISGNILIINENKIQFGERVEKVIQFNDKFIVLLLNKPFSQEQPEDNFYAVDKNGKILWRIQDCKKIYSYNHEKVYVNIGIYENKLFATLYIGIVYYLNPEDGNIVGKSYAK